VDPDLYRRTLPAILDDDGFGSVVLAIILTDPKTTQLKLPPIVSAIRELRPDKPVIFAALDEGAPFDFPQLKELRELRVACFPSPERALRALAYVTRRAQLERCDRAGSHDGVKIADLRPGILSEVESKKVLAQLGIPIPAGRLTKTPQEAASVADEIGYPIALKAQSPELPHKSDVGGVILGVHSAAELLERWTELIGNVRSADPHLVLDGVLVEQMGSKGVELIVGARNDPQWGPVVMAGFGGVLAEAINDVRLMPADLSRSAMEEELDKLRCAALLRGFRGAPALDVSAAAAVLETIGGLMRACPRIVEVDINPLAVYERGKGVLALDALIAVEKEDR
jgi:acyl-CoA synthetase (NDP forming)